MQPPAITPEDLYRSFLGSLTFGIDIAVGIVIAISIIRGFIMYVKLLRKSPLDQTKEEEGIKRYVGVINNLVRIDQISHTTNFSRCRHKFSEHANVNVNIHVTALLERTFYYMIIDAG